MNSKKNNLFALILLSIASVMFVAEAGVWVTNVTVQQRYPWNGLVDIDYEVMVDDLEQEVSIYPIGYDRQNGHHVLMTTLTGDGAAEAKVRAGRHHMVWNMAADAPSLASTNFSVNLQAVIGKAPYLIVDLSRGVDALSYPVQHMVAIPEGGWGDEFKTTKIVLHLIEPDTFLMGSPEDELGRFANESQHQVTLTRSYYIGVFELTQKQWELVMGSNPSSDIGDMRPVEKVSYDMIRGNNLGSQWPANNMVDSASFMGMLRMKTGLTFDLPTEAQWEYACRAGTGTALNSGRNLLNLTNDVNMAEVGRYRYNQSDGKGGGVLHTKVGSYLPNAWGLYDMHGNEWECCLDWYGIFSGAATDPQGAVTGNTRILRGGGCVSVASNCRSAQRNGDHPPSSNVNGLRVAVQLTNDLFVSVAFAPDGGTVNPATKTVKLGSAYGALPIPARDGYDFSGWWKEPGGGALVGLDTLVNDVAPHTLYARWTQRENGLYMVVDLSGGTNAASYSVSYLDGIPVGGWTDEYKTDKLVLRKIPAGTFTMGSPEDELGRNSDEGQHHVTLTKPYYIGVFEVTQKQWTLVAEGNPSGYKGDVRPVEQMSYDMLRGNNLGSQWPANNMVDSASFMGILRSKSGLTFDLPTEAQWEYACRAGTITALNNGKKLTATNQCPNLAEVGRYGYNTLDGKGGAQHTKVGSYFPNMWGLYDMHGNVEEWCLDWYGNYSGVESDPKGIASGYYRITRGGGWYNYYIAQYCRSACRYAGTPSKGYSDCGLRVVAPAVEP